MLETLRFNFSVLLGTHTLLDRSLRVLQLWKHLSKLTANGQECNPYVYSLGYRLGRAFLITLQYIICMVRGISYTS